MKKQKLKQINIKGHPEFSPNTGLKSESEDQLPLSLDLNES